VTGIHELRYTFRVMDSQGQSDAREHAPLLGYATPLPLARAGVLFRDGKIAVARDGSELPALCVLCGEEAMGKTLRLTFTWDASFQVTRQKSTLELRKSGTVQAHLCSRHYRRWAAGRIIGVGGMILSGIVMTGGIVLAAVSENSDVPRWSGVGIGALMLGFGMMILFLFVFALRTRTMSCKRIEGGFLYLAGAGEGFLRGLAPIPEEMKV
jgi:hypothetical protein